MLKLKCDGTQVGALFAPANGGRVSGVAAARVSANCGVNTVQFTAALQSNLEQDKAVKVALAHTICCNVMSGPMRDGAAGRPVLRLSWRVLVSSR